ncbi:MAG: zf-HC2 domain-containing protein [Elusimicrobia bacterium]|nr:zf-HC2 domain-containing protein [Elusimicrobiota bacterium]MBU2615016.1 zf-HC2 domain-containing protein [Elusimicrobiota bacterium]
MNCKKIQKYLAGCLANELDEAIRNEVNIHLQGCPACNEDYQSLLKVKSMLSSLPGVKLPDNIMENIEQEVERRMSEKKTSYIRFAIPSAALALAAVLAVFFLKIPHQKYRNNYITDICLASETIVCGCWDKIGVKYPGHEVLLSKEKTARDKGYASIKDKHLNINSSAISPEQFVVFTKFNRGGVKAVLYSDDVKVCRKVVESKNKYKYIFKNPASYGPGQRDLVITVTFQS